MDDEDMTREMVSDLLGEMGYHVIPVKDGQEAIKKFQENKANGNLVDCIIMDLTIPGGMGGEQAVVKIKAIDPEVKVIVASGYSADPVMANYQAYGFDGAVVKPFNGNYLKSSTS